MPAQTAQGSRRAARQRARQARAYLRRGAIALIFVAAPAAAEVAATPDGFTVTHTRTVEASPASAWTALVDWGSWWGDGHSWSGKAANIALDAIAGGCLCERWPGGEVAHGRVLAALPGKRLVMEAPFGPLQALPVSTRLDFTLAAAGTGTRITLVMRVAGDTAKPLGAPVDGVMREAIDRLARRVDAAGR